jgi:hypothetical protein
MLLRYIGTSVHERFSSRTHFLEKKSLGWRTVFQAMNTQAGNNGWQQAGSIGSAGEHQLLCNFRSVHIVSFYEHFGRQTASRNELNLWTEVPLYCNISSNQFDAPPHNIDILHKFVENILKSAKNLTLYQV